MFHSAVPRFLKQPHFAPAKFSAETHLQRWQGQRLKREEKDMP